MKKIGLVAAILGLGAVVVFGLGTNAMADWGWGGGHMMGWGGGRHMGYYGNDGYGPGRMMGGYGYGRGYGKELTDEQIGKVESERKAFYEATEDLREQLFDKQRELAREFDKENPDNAKAESLQSEISKLRAELDQKRIDHMLNLRKIVPDADSGYGPGYGMRGGRGYGRGGYGRGGFGAPCWN